MTTSPSCNKVNSCPPGERRTHNVLPPNSTVAVSPSMGVGVRVGVGVWVGVGDGVGVADAVDVGFGVSVLVG